jgi:DNA-binding XRE family transcriptional regulator
MAKDLILLHLVDVFARGVEPTSDQKLPDGHEWLEIPMGGIVASKSRGLREAAGLTVREAASRMGVSAGTYQRWENLRTCNASVDTLSRIAKAYGKELAIAFK